MKQPDRKRRLSFVETALFRYNADAEMVERFAAVTKMRPERQRDIYRRLRRAAASVLFRSVTARILLSTTERWGSLYVF